ncbi:Vaculolar membrane protein [Glomus cerebriforme]|uniref:Vaculolar membrane protein n=1 Tax=Glomus cerebriforme TaxID=658196 RepID=A0A397T5K3_9GLOM|nr:Vaculolar membrane protein [Glomus cerebriforme]
MRKKVEQSPHEQNCVLVDNFAIFVQVLLGTIAFSTLIYKRHRERPQRQLQIWFYDVSKQLLGAGIVHGLNIVVSYIAGSIDGGGDTNPCVWYFLNIFIDCTLGVFILYVLLKIVDFIVAIACIEGMKSGDYGHPPNANWWIRQIVAFICCLFVMKIIVVLIFRLCPFLFDAGEFLLGWTLYNAKLQVVFVMLIIPLVMNIVQFWLVDQVIKKKLEGVKLEDNDDFGDEDAFLSEALSDDDEEMGGSSISVSSNTAILAREAFLTDKDINDNSSDIYIELRKTPAPSQVIRKDYFEK